MSYISKNTGAFVNARLTDKGRELLSIGQLNFTTYRLGDSEVDYSTLGVTYNIAKENVLRPKANQPNIKTPIFPNVSISALQPVVLSSVVNSPEKGFFTYTSGATPIEYTAYTTSNYVVQADTFIPITGMNGTSIVNVLKGSDYVTGSTEPSVGDFMLVKMSNPELTSTQNKGVVEVDSPVPYLWYKVQSLSGTASADTLTITVDRNLPNFSTSTSTNQSSALFYPANNSGTTFDYGIYSGGSVWNMNNVWTFDMVGVDTSVYEGFDTFGSESFVGSKEYYGYTTEFQLSGDTDGFCNNVNSISILHYSNVESCINVPEQIYGEKFYVDTTIGQTPIVKMPTLMWHRRQFSGSSTGNRIGYDFLTTGSTKAVTLGGNITGIQYYDLVDSNTPTIAVGRLFPDLQTITIDDQELVAALSYKSNRNWTLPTLGYGLSTNANGLISQTQDVYVTYILSNGSSGYTSSLPCQNITCVKYAGAAEPCAPDASNKNVEITFPSGQLPYMTQSGGIGWYADTFEILVQRVVGGTIPNPASWVKLDYTANISGHTMGDRINPIDLENTTFTITNDLYTNSGSTFNLHDYINIPEIGETEILQFGDEDFFYGNMEASGLNRKYRTLFDFTIPPNQWNFSTNPTFNNSGQNVHISELGVYDNVGNLVAIGKFISPIEKTNVTTIILEVALDF